MPPITGTVKVAAPVTPANTASPYPSHFAEWGHGGYRAVATIADRDAIIPARRGEGMVVFVKEDKTDYTLEDGIENSNWVVKNYPGSSTGGSTGGGTGGGDTGGGTGGGDTGGTGGDVTNNITNKDIKNYFYYDGCVPGNFSKLDALIRNVADGNPDALYRDKDGNIVISAVDQSYFTFNTTSKSWINDFHYISGTLDTIAQNGGNVILTIIDPDSEEIIINVNDEIAADDAVSNGFINDLKWSGYISFSKPGIYTISANQLNEQGEKSDTITQTVNIVEKEFTIEHDGMIDTPQDLIERLTPLTEQTYNFAMLPGSSFVVSLVRVNVTDTGIDRKRYATVSGTQKLIDADNTSYVLPETLWDETIEDGLYSLLITGKDGGTKIPYYFYGPFSIHINDALHDGVSDNYTNDEYDVPFAPPPPINEEDSYVLPPITPDDGTSGSGGSGGTGGTTTSDIEQYIDDSLETAFFAAMDTLYAGNYPSDVDTYIASMDLSGMDSSNIDTYVQQIYEAVLDVGSSTPTILIDGEEVPYIPPTKDYNLDPDGSIADNIENFINYALYELEIYYSDYISQEIIDYILIDSNPADWTPDNTSDKIEEIKTLFPKDV